MNDRDREEPFLAWVLQSELIRAALSDLSMYSVRGVHVRSDEALGKVTQDMIITGVIVPGG